MRVVKFALFIAVACWIYPLGVGSTETLTLDGRWWMTLSETEKLTAAEALVAGYRAGFVDGRDAQERKSNLTLWHDPVYRYGASMLDAGPAAARKAVLREYDSLDKHATHPLTPWVGEEITIGTIADKMSDLFRDHPEALSMEVQWFTACAARPEGSCESTINKIEHK